MPTRSIKRASWPSGSAARSGWRIISSLIRRKVLRPCRKTVFIWWRSKWKRSRNRFELVAGHVSHRCLRLTVGLPFRLHPPIRDSEATDTSRMVDKGETTPVKQASAEEQAKAFFLALAAKGKEAWNAWRRDPANKDAYVTFKGVDFSVAPRNGIDFSGFEFGDWADFSRCKWGGGDWDQVRGAYPDVFKPGRACFTDASFGDRASFEGAAFGDFASFTGAAFGDLATFKGATFGAYASFAGPASFGDRASFEGAVLGFGARFGAVDFHGSVSFDDAT